MYLLLLFYPFHISRYYLNAFLSFFLTASNLCTSFSLGQLAIWLRFFPRNNFPLYDLWKWHPAITIQRKLSTGFMYRCTSFEFHPMLLSDETEMIPTLFLILYIENTIVIHKYDIIPTSWTQINKETENHENDLNSC